ncbi:MAG TPA: lysylphosphatidylglycerol synthase domain-containing protein [Longimicrobiales bacterium]|nr:lysylphosphatidylglycerol synthase domain-containing protein [Longimicrobiales bacterium]
MSGPRLLARLAQLALLGIVLWFVYRAVAPQLAELQPGDLTRWRPAVLPLAGSFVVLVGVYVAHALLWRRILGDLALGRPSVRETLRVYFLASLGRYVPGKVWQLAGMAVLAGRIGLPPVKATAAAILGQIAFLLTGMLFLAVCMPGFRGVEALEGSPAIAWMGAAAVALGLGAVVVWGLVATRFGHGLREWAVRRAGERAGEKIRRAFELADTVRTGDALAWAAFYALTWVALGAAFVAFAAAFVPDAWNAPRYLAGTIAASYLLGYVLPLPAGIGGREAVMIVLLGPVTGPGAAVVISILSRVWFTAAELVPLMLLPLVPAAPIQEETA